MSFLNVEDLYLNRAKFVMKCLGVWLPKEKETILDKARRYFMLSLQFILLLFQIIYFVQVWGDLEAVSEASYVLFTQACLCFKIAVFHVNADILRDLLVRMKGEALKPRLAKHEIILEVQAKRIKRLLLSFVVAAQATCCLWALKPLLDDAQSRKFPLDMWMPMKPDELSNQSYYFCYTFQFATICMSAYIYFGVDSVALSSVIFACAQIEIIKDKLMGIKSPLNKNLAHKDMKKKRDENYKKLIECAVQHKEVVTFTELVEKAYHAYLLFTISGGVGLFCMSALRILMVEWKSMQFLSIVLYLSVMVSQLYVCCWCGHELTAMSEDLHRVLYECSWYEQDIRFQKALAFIMMRASRPMVLRAGHYIGLSRQTFVAILRMSYSYFAVLNQQKKVVTLKILAL